MSNEKKYDIVVYGATSFVGQILAKYMHEQFGDTALTYALAGRSLSKLESVKAELGTPDRDVIVADAADEDALTAMCENARVVISTVGPYALYGEPLVKICAQTGTDYCDLTGETQFIKRMQDRYADLAAQSGARIVHCCGFDSIPSDLGVHFLQNRAVEQFGKTCPDVKMRVAVMKGAASGGTIASMVNIFKEIKKDKTVRKVLVDPYALCPQGHGFTARQHNTKMEYDDDVESWLAPFVMAGINTRIVHRSNALSAKRYGDQFLYEEAMMTGSGKAGKSRARKMLWGLGAFMAGASMGPIRWMLERFILPKPGSGPTPEQQVKGKYVLLFRGTTEDGDTIKTRVTGDQDPGYGSTAKMLGQAAACLAQDVATDTPGGFWTPATLLGDKLIDRLESHSGVTFKVD
ncbi:MAG: saccharopine dehydrogenase NADP-binding domain-containing protein [Pseudomonadota bacterium]